MTAPRGSDAPAPAGGLAALQRRMARWVTAPEGLERRLGDPEEAAEVRTVLRGDAAAPAAARLGVYAHAYRARIARCLREDFGAVARALGDEAFGELVDGYLAAHPPRHPSLRFAGDRLPRFLAEDAAAAPLRARCPWAADLAAFEWALVDVFDAPDAAPLGRAELAAVPPDAWAELRLQPVPALRLVDAGWPVHRVREAAQRGADAPLPELPREATRLRVWRRDERLCWRAVGAAEADALRTLQAGATFGALCETLAARDGEAAAPARAAGLLAAWVDDGVLARDAGPA